MSTFVDKLINALAYKAFDSFYTAVRGSGLAKEESQVVQAIDSMKTLISSDTRRPLDVRLGFPETCNGISRVVDRLQETLLSDKELLLLQYRVKRLFNLLENILVQHELLTIEAIRTLKVITRIVKWTSIVISASLVYLYVRRFHSNSRVYKLLAEHRWAVTVALGCITISSYCYCNHNKYLKSLSFIS